MNDILNKGKKIFFAEQNTILSAAAIIATMTIASQVLGLIRQRVVLHFFNSTDAALFFAALRLPELVFEILIYGMFSSAFVPVFTKAFKKDEKEAWQTAGRVVSIGLLIFLFFGIIVAIWAEKIYTVIAPGFSPDQIKTIANMARIMFVAQGIFVVSYVMTSVLESLKRFLIPALAPIFYNLGLILSTLILAPKIGLAAPAIGVVVGASVHFLIQLPLAWKLGFRFTPIIKPNPEVKSIAKLAAPRLFDLSIQQVVDMTVLYFASLISAASYTWYTLANSLQSAPIRLIGISLAKAALPTLTRETDNPKEFKRTLLKTLNQMFFLILPIVALFVVLRIPTVRIFFGTSLFDWDSTVGTGMILSAFALGIPFQATVALFARGFYAFHDTRTPVMVSVVGDTLIVAANISLVGLLHLPAWALGASFSLGAFIEVLILSYILSKRIKIFTGLASFVSILKSLFAALISGGVMFFLLKFFDRWTWVTRLKRSIPFENFVLDTNYTVNLVGLTIFVAVVGVVVYLLISIILKSEELMTITRAVFKKKVTVEAPITIDNA